MEFQSEPKCLRTKGSQWYKTSSESEGPRMRNTNVQQQVKVNCKLKESKLTLPQPFLVYSSFHQSRWCPPTLVKVVFFTQSRFKYKSLPETLSQVYPGIMVYQPSEHPLAQSIWHINLNITQWGNENELHEFNNLVKDYLWIGEER